MREVREIIEQKTEREDILNWLALPETKFFIEKLNLELDEVLNAMLNLTSFGEEMAKDYYSLKGSASGLRACLTLMRDLAEGVE